MQCPVCEDEIPTEEFMLHAMLQHPQFFVVWATFSMPTLAPNYQLLINTVEQEYDEFENLGYEDLLNLCDTIGYHKVGVQNVDAIAPHVNDCESDWQCPICLETRDNVETVRKILTCGHRFCSCCIEKWFTENKLCPVCKNDVVPSLDEVD